MKMQCYIFVGEHYFLASSASKCLWVLAKEVSMSPTRHILFGNHDGGTGNIVLVSQAKRGFSYCSKKSPVTRKVEWDWAWENLQTDHQTQPYFEGSWVRWSNGACPCLCYTCQCKGRAFLTRQEGYVFQIPFISAIKLLMNWPIEMFNSKLSIYKASDAP